jgi:hypothetical protein
MVSGIGGPGGRSPLPPAGGAAQPSHIVPPVRVTEITAERNQLISSYRKKPVDLGGAHSFTAALAELNVTALLTATRSHQVRVFLLEWEGGKVPRGVDLLGKKIGWTQNGLVTAEDGSEIGTYDRLVECGGDSGKEQKMIVYMENPPLQTAR